MIGYNFNFNKLDINLKAGVGVGFLVKRKAQYINYELNNLITPEPKKINLNYIISPTINYQIAKQVSLQLNPQVLINSSTLINYKNINQRYTNWSLHLGLSYTFKN